MWLDFSWDIETKRRREGQNIITPGERDNSTKFRQKKKIEIKYCAEPPPFALCDIRKHQGTLASPAHITKDNS